MEGGSSELPEPRLDLPLEWLLNEAVIGRILSTVRLDKTTELIADKQHGN